MWFPVFVGSLWASISFWVDGQTNWGWLFFTVAILSFLTAD